MDVTIDLVHNSILQQTVSEAFAASVQEQLLPLLLEQYGDRLSAIQMYEDHLADDLMQEGYWYYPLTAVLDGVPQTVWIRWLFHKGAFFPTGIPYAYVGEESLVFELVPTPPSEFVERVAGRDIWFEGGYISLTVQAAAADPTFLSGKYSQTFADEMTRQLHEAISTAASVEGLADSGIELSLIFAPESYMEHTSENVTYRRLLMTAKGCAPRDFWIKWTRLNAAVAYSVSEHVQRGSIVFSLGEDVPHKVREKEYRFLVGHNTDKYQCAMGRRNITEWRDLIKRAIKRGELTHRDHPTLLSEAADPLYDKLSALLDRYGVSAPTAETVDTVPAAQEAGVDETLRLVREAVDREQSCTEAYTPTAEDLVCGTMIADGDSEAREEPDEPAVVDEPVAEDEPVAMDAEPVAQTVPAMATAAVTPVASDADASSGAALDSEETPVGDDDRQASWPDEATAVDTPSAPDAWEQQVLASHQQMEESYRRTEEQMRAELEAKIRLEYESRARREAEEAAERLRKEKEQLRLENERLAAEARRAEERRQAEEEARRAEEARLRAQIESSQRAEARERERAAEAARLALEQSQRLEAERREREAQQEAERRRQEEERAALEAERMRAEARRLEEERRRAEEEERQREREAALARAEEARRRAEQEARQRAEADRALRVESVKAVTEAAETPVATADAEPVAPAAPTAPASAEEPMPTPPAEDAENADETFGAQSASGGRGDYTYTSRVVDLLFRHPVDPNVTGRIHEIIAITLDYFQKSDVYMRVKATISEGQKVVLNFVEFPEEETELLINIIKVLGNSDLGIMKIILE